MNRIIAAAGTLALAAGLIVTGCGSAASHTTAAAPAASTPAPRTPTSSAPAAPVPTMTVTATPPPVAAPAPSSQEPSGPPETPQQQLADAVVGGTDTTTGATVVSATVGLMCSAKDSSAVDSNGGLDHLADGWSSCNEANAWNRDDGFWSADSDYNAPISEWTQQGIWTTATGEIQMSDGTQYVVNIDVDNSGNVTWAGRTARAPGQSGLR